MTLPKFQVAPTAARATFPYADPAATAGQDLLARAPLAGEPLHIALVGMPGAGKTTAGALLAQALGWEFVDLDATIETASGKPLAALFAEQGEVSFRAQERSQLRGLLLREQPMVLACGGGTWADGAMRRELVRRARPVLLKAPLETLLGRLTATDERQTRPLLAGPDPKAALERLWRARQELHAICPRQVDCDQVGPTEVAERIAKALAEPAPPMLEPAPPVASHPSQQRTTPPAATTKAAEATVARATAARSTEVNKTAEAPVPTVGAEPVEAAAAATTTSTAVDADPCEMAAKSPALAAEPEPAPAPIGALAAPTSPSSHRAPVPQNDNAFLAFDTQAFVSAPMAELDAQSLPTPAAKSSTGLKPFLLVHSKQGDYPIYLLDPPAARAGEPSHAEHAHEAVAACIDRHTLSTRVAIIADNEVAARHSEGLVRALKARGLAVLVHTFAAGEEAKRLASAHALYDELADAGHGREDTLVALGGGVTTDLAGFVASTYMRGLPLVQVPTSTLAAIDASIGGKTGLNTRRGKNLVGTFFSPKAVVIQPAYLTTQSLRAHRAGLVEAIKIAALMDAGLMTEIAAHSEELLHYERRRLKDVIGRALKHKALVVERDEHEASMRAWLNYGHTLGHAIEVGENFRCLHGEAVGLGLLAEATWAECTGHAEGVVAPLTTVLQAVGVDTDWRRAKVDLDALGRDKKRMGDTLKLPVATRLGNATIVPVALTELIDFAQGNMQPNARWQS